VSSIRSKWLVVPRPNPAAAIRLVCCASAGLGPAMFRAWLPLLPPTIELSMVHLPGRESRWSEPCLHRMEDLAREIADALIERSDPHFALFGHSLGALVAFEVTRAIRRANGREPVHLFASAHRAPQVPLRYPKIAGLSDDAFVTEVDARHGGIPPEVASNRELMELMLPSLKADYGLFEAYTYVREEPLSCPISVFGGTRDAYISEADLDAWREQTSGRFWLRMIEGGHFFVNDDRPTVVASVVDRLAIAGS
jgi:medium-chain acyl-[acyl-carrier-protein] hydrolase